MRRIFAEYLGRWPLEKNAMEPVCRLVFSIWCAVAGVVAAGGVVHAIYRLNEIFSQGDVIGASAAFFSIFLAVALTITGFFAHGVSTARDGPVNFKLKLTCYLLGIPIWLLFLYAIFKKR
jgi:hypothetical protein